MTDTIDTAATTDTADRELKARHRAMWGRIGDYPYIAIDLIAELGPRLVDAVGIHRGERVLDVAAGPATPRCLPRCTGRRSWPRTSPPSCSRRAGRSRLARASTLTWEEGDAENLPYGDDAFDVVLSCIGVMFAPRHQRAADELVRVCRPGGPSACSAGRPTGFIGQMFAR